MSSGEGTRVEAEMVVGETTWMVAIRLYKCSNSRDLFLEAVVPVIVDGLFNSNFIKS